MKKTVNVVAIKDNWILHEYADHLAMRLDYVQWTEKATGRSRLTYYINYAQAPDERITEIESALFTHIEEGQPQLVDKWWRTAKRLDVLVCMSKMYARKMTRDCAPSVVIKPGVDLEAYKLRPVRIGLVGSVKGSGRKGEGLLKKVMDIPGIEWRFAGSGWPGPAKLLKVDEVPAFYADLDYVLIPSWYEGGPMPAVEALASGVPIISTEVGWVPDLPHISFKRDDEPGLRKILEGLVAERAKLRASVADQTWDNYAAAHDRLFRALLDIPAGPLSRRQARKSIRRAKL